MADTYRTFGSTPDLVRGVGRLMLELGHSPLAEFTLPSGRRLDIAAVTASGGLIGVEIKVSVEDLRGDRKWPEYLEYCDQYFFAVPDGFPEHHLPADHGLIIADRFGGAIVGLRNSFRFQRRDASPCSSALHARLRNALHA